MFINHFKELIWSATYVAIQHVIMFAVHFHYSDIFTYHFFNGLLAFNNLHAIQVYETVITELYIATILTVLSGFPLIWFHFICYLISGFYHHEILKFNSLYVKVLMSFIFESIVCLFIFIPHALGRGGLKGYGGEPYLRVYRERIATETERTPPHDPLTETMIRTGTIGVIQIYSYANVTNLTVRLIIIWGILAILLRMTTWQRKYLPLIIFIMSVWVTPPDLKIQGGLTLALFIYLEVYVWIRLWKARINKALRKS